MVHFIKSLIGFLIIGSVLLAACDPSQVLPTDHVVLRTGISLQTPAGITLKADSVSVSICPENVSCFAPNNASLRLNLSKGAQSTSVRLFSWIPNYGVRRPVHFSDITDSASVELEGQRYKVILRDGRYLKDDNSSLPRTGEVVVQVAPL